ncbi:hypothetical protein [Halarcobacter bivalviorum]|uniref:Transformation system protein n=1 Tax=Halarcobacter bivalviorum TaxID=663364 RepID=A0AAX2A6I6_9BACT|nr:hypothetical protein [Halarcobacter bivalviorum]AXH13008.1 hypothetical protein ABIV_2031 [Halarcobacter bivalviorum]RXK09187.1 hypothetical protein CRV05_11420 [Halarcobacter bivalviorum]
MQLLNHLEDSFEKSSLKVKIELFLFPLILAFLFFYILKNSEDNYTGNTFSGNIFIQKKQMDKSYIELIKDIENYLSKNQIELINISNFNEKIQMELSSQLVKSLKFLNFIENYNNFSKIESIKIDNTKVYLNLNFQQSYVKKENKNIEEQLKFLEEYEEYTKKLELKAIVGKMVLINDKWLTIDEKINNSFTLLKINKDSVILEKEKIEFELRLYKNESL